MGRVINRWSPLWSLLQCGGSSSTTNKGGEEDTESQQSETRWGLLTLVKTGTSQHFSSAELWCQLAQLAALAGRSSLNGYTSSCTVIRWINSSSMTRALRIILSNQVAAEASWSLQVNALKSVIWGISLVCAYRLWGYLKQHNTSSAVPKIPILWSLIGYLRKWTFNLFKSFIYLINKLSILRFYLW